MARTVQPPSRPPERGVRRLLGPAAACLGLLACAAPAPLVAGTIESAAPRAPERAVEGEREALELRLWRAGRPLHPGLSAGRENELAAERTRAVTTLAETVGASELQRWRRWLEDPSTPDELWCVAAHAAAALGRYDLAPAFAAALHPSVGPRRAAAARAALHVLYGSWFQQPAEARPFLEEVEGGAGTRLLVGTILAQEARARERLLTELAHEPAGAAEYLGHPDPEVRSGAATLLGRVFTQEGADSTSALEALIAHLEAEHEAHAFHEGLRAAGPPLERARPDDPLSLRLRALLFDIARQEGEPRSLSAAQALARLPWRKDGPRDLGHVLSGVEALGAMVRGLAGADQRRGINDPDPLVAVLSALRQLCDQAAQQGLASELGASPARASLLVVLDDRRQDPAARAAAAAALGPLMRPDDGVELAALLRDPSLGAPVKHALLGALRGLLSGLRPGDPGARELLAAVAEVTGAPDVDLRRRALALLAEPGLESLVRSLDPAFLVERLRLDGGRETTVELLRLLQRFGGSELLGPVLALERFDALCADPATLDALAPVLLRLAGRNGAEVMAAASALATAAGEETSLARLRHALALVSGLDDPTAYALAPGAHRAVRAWVWRATRAGMAPRDLAPTGLAFERRLLTVHLPLGEGGDAGGTGMGPFESAHLVALLRADVFLGGGGERGTKQEVESAFEGALASAGSDEDAWLVLRDRGRFRAAANECVKALSDYRRLVEDGEPAEALLGIPDLRSAVELLGRLDEAGGKGRSSTAGEACELLRRLIARRAWRAEPASVRMQDLRNWVRTAVDSADVESLKRVEAALADLPLTQAETQAERDPPPLWFGLTREAAWFQELLDLRMQARLGLRSLEARG